MRAYGYLSETTLGGQYFRGKTRSGAEFFMSDLEIQIASNAKAIFLDGTFCTTPRPFYQTLYIRAKVGDNVFTIGHALLPNKHESSYFEVLEMLKSVCAAADHPVGFTDVHCDAERAIINSVRRVFPDSNINLCWFHTAKSIRRQAATLGLTDLISKNPEFAKFVERCRNIFFLPAELWARTWTKMLESLGDGLQTIPAVQLFIR